MAAAGAAHPGTAASARSPLGSRLQQQRPVPTRSGPLRAGSAADHVARAPARVAPPPNGAGLGQLARPVSSAWPWPPPALRPPGTVGRLQARGCSGLSLLSSCPNSASGSGGFLGSPGGPRAPRGAHEDPGRPRVPTCGPDLSLPRGPARPKQPF